VIKQKINALLKSENILDLLMLYISKSGAIVVGVFILPWYQQLLGASAFGWVALIFSLQTFLIMLDLGVSTIVGRDIAASENAESPKLVWRAGEWVLHSLYLILFLLSSIAYIFFDFYLSFLQVTLCLIFFWSLTVQNAGQSVLLARKEYRIAALIQAAGVLARAIATLAALYYYKADINTFLFVQVLFAIAQMCITSAACRKILHESIVGIDVEKITSVAKSIFMKGRPLVFFGISGAAVLQLDKIIIGSFSKPELLASYYLAMTLCLVPVSVLAGPVAQYFQPKIIRSFVSKDILLSEQQIKSMLTILIGVVALPSAILWINREIIIHAWLHGQPNSAEVAHYAGVLLPGIALGALGYVPYTLLVAGQDYRAQALMSVFMTVCTLAAVTFFARTNNILAICWAYTLYHSISMLISWARVFYLKAELNIPYAARAAAYAFFLVFSVVVVLSAIALGKNIYYS
jgi:O-antigen/teichoic acid export membrane protein